MIEYSLMKRIFDVVVSACALLATSPLILAAAVAVRLTSPGPAFYPAKRAGREGQPFHMLKLRTMRVGTDTADRRITAKHDDRITPIGALLRKSRIDELPQLWNVLKGDMSIVGPRPEDWDIVDKQYTPAQRKVLSVRPGLSSLANVNWYPDLTYHDPPPQDMPMQEWYLRRHLPIQVTEGIRYVEQQSLLLDLKIIMQTIFCILVRSWWLPPQRPLPSEQGRMKAEFSLDTLERGR